MRKNLDAILTLRQQVNYFQSYEISQLFSVESAVQKEIIAIAFQDIIKIPIEFGSWFKPEVYSFSIGEDVDLAKGSYSIYTEYCRIPTKIIIGKNPILLYSKTAKAFDELFVKKDDSDLTGWQKFWGKDVVQEELADYYKVSMPKKDSISILGYELDSTYCNSMLINGFSDYITTTNYHNTENIENNLQINSFHQENKQTLKKSLFVKPLMELVFNKFYKEMIGIDQENTVLYSTLTNFMHNNNDIYSLGDRIFSKDSIKPDFYKKFSDFYCNMVENLRPLNAFTAEEKNKIKELKEKKQDLLKDITELREKIKIETSDIMREILNDELKSLNDNLKVVVAQKNSYENTYSTTLLKDISITCQKSNNKVFNLAELVYQSKNINDQLYTAYSQCNIKVINQTIEKTNNGLSINLLEFFDQLLLPKDILKTFIQNCENSTQLNTMLFLEDKYQNTLFSFIIKNSKDTQLIKFIFGKIAEEKENFQINFLSICDKTLQLENLIFLNQEPHPINQYYEYYFYTINFIVSTVYTYYKMTSYPEIIASSFAKTNDFYQYFGYNYLTAAPHLPPPTINIQNTGIYYAPSLLLQLTVSLIPSIIVFSTKENLFHTEDTQRELIIQCIELVNLKANDETLISQQSSEEAHIKPYDDIDNLYGNDEL